MWQALESTKYYINSISFLIPESIHKFISFEKVQTIPRGGYPTGASLYSSFASLKKPDFFTSRWPQGWVDLHNEIGQLCDSGHIGKPCLNDFMGFLFDLLKI
jgi:hypothetical protein